MRRRILLAVGGAFLVMLVITLGTSGSILRDSYARLEQRYMDKDVRRVRNEIDAQCDAVGHIVTDYATWTEMYDFVRHPTKEFTDENLSGSLSSNLRLSVAAVANAAGHVVFVRTASNDPAKKDLGEHLAWWLAQHPWLAHFSDKHGAAQGIISMPEGILLVASRPILDSAASLPVGGALIFGRLLDDEIVSGIGDRLMLTAQAMPVGGPLDPAAARALAHLGGGKDFYLDTARTDIVSGYAVMNDVEKAPAILLRVDSPRDIHAQGRNTLWYFYVWLAIIAVGFFCVVLFTLERTVVSRLLVLSRSVLAIGTGGSSDRRVDIKGKDQIAYLGAAINGMLDALARSTEELRSSEKRSLAFLDAVPDVIFRVTRDGTILDARAPQKLPLLETANNLVGKDVEQILFLYSFISPPLFDKSLALVEEALAAGAPRMLSFDVDVQSGRRFYEERFVPSGPDEVLVLVREVTDRVRAEESERKETLLKEIHHRVKNNLQVISSLLALQAGSTNDPATRAMLTESRDRVRSMALIHEKLYQEGDRRGVSFAAYVRDLAAHLRHSYTGNSENVSVLIDADEMSLDMDVSVPCGLIITELLSNSLKYAFPGGRKGTVTVGLRRDAAGTITLSVRDDGVGFPPGQDIHSPATLGLRIVNTLVAQLKGDISLAGGTESGAGAAVIVTFPCG